MFHARFGDFASAEQGIGKSALGVEFLHFAAAPGRHFSPGRSEWWLVAPGSWGMLGGTCRSKLASLMHFHGKTRCKSRKMMINPWEFRGNDLLHPNLREMFAGKDRWRQSAVSKIDTSVRYCAKNSPTYIEPLHCLEGSLLWQEMLGGQFVFCPKKCLWKKN